MSYLPLANILHRRLRSVLCMLAVSIGIAMMIVMLGLSHGTLNEVAQRMQSVPAEMLVMPPGENAIYMAGGYFSEGHEKILRQTQVNGKPVIKRVIASCWQAGQLGGQKQRVFGVDRNDLMEMFGTRKLLEGRVFDAEGKFEQAVAKRAGPNGAYDTDAMPAEELKPGLEIIIDKRLQDVGKFKVNQPVELFGKTFTIVGVVESGAAGRVFAPIQTMRHLTCSGLRKSTMYFVQLTDPNLTNQAVAAVENELGAQVIPKSAYTDILYQGFAQIYTFINIASGVALTVCFLFILLTMYTLVLERTREIGILRSLGATRLHVVRLAIEEALMLCTGGTLLGIGLAFLVKHIVEWRMPLQTIDLQPRWLALALLIGIVGGVGSAIYPGYRAARLDPATALAFE